MTTLAAQAIATSKILPIRVGFVLHIMQVAGAEMLVAATIRRLIGQIEPTILCLDGVGALGEILMAEGITVIDLGRRPGRDLRVAWRLARLIRARGIEVLHAHQYTPFFYAALAKTLVRPRPRLILTEHGRHYPDMVSRPRRMANSILLSRWADATNAVSAFSAAGLAEADGFHRDPVTVIENGIDLDRYAKAPDQAAARIRLGLDPARRYLIHVARCHPVKDQAMLLRAFAAARFYPPDVDLLMIGDGPLRADLEHQAAVLGIADRVHFLGVRHDIPAILAVGDAFALTSLSEAASLTLLEAMASELPVVVTAVGGNPEIVRPGIEGLLVPRGDAQATALAFEQILGNPSAAARMGAAARARVADRYRLEQTIAAYLQLYQRLGCPWVTAPAASTR